MEESISDLNVEKTIIEESFIKSLNEQNKLLQ
jgi:hypothetical protein